MIYVRYEDAAATESLDWETVWFIADRQFTVHLAGASSPMTERFGTSGASGVLRLNKPFVTTPD